MDNRNIAIVSCKECSGCGVCAAVCPKNCIDFEFKESGFWHPTVREDLCIGCQICVNYCPCLRTMNFSRPEGAYACYAKDCKIVEESSSGGIFTLLAKEVLTNGGIVYGAEFCEDFFEVRHTRISDIENLGQIRGSKYVQSNINNIYEQIRMDLQKDIKVLFSGTPCQCSAIRAVFGETDLLLTVDFICHGVPSPMVWKSYLKSLSRYKKDKIVSAQFRNKDWDWRFFQMKLVFANGRKYWESKESGPFLRYFFSDNSLRESCYQCKYRQLNRISDFTMSDYWDVNSEMPDFENSRGTSYCSINTEKGRLLWNKIMQYCIFREAKLDYLMKSLNPVRSKDVESAFKICQSDDVYRKLKKMQKKTLRVRIQLLMRIRTNAKRLVRKMRLLLE